MRLTYEREMFILSDGGTIALDWGVKKPDPDQKRPIIVVMPGLTSTSKELYVENFLKLAH